MNRPEEPSRRTWTRGRLIRAVLAGSAVVGGGAATASWTGGGPAAAAPSDRTDVEVLNVFLLLERVQEDFYRAAIRQGRLEGELRTFARTVGAQESEHVERLAKRLGRRARSRPETDFGDAITDAQRFRDTTIMLEEATIAAYISQGANLTRDAVAAVVPMVSIEARQVAWMRDLAGVSPAPRAADPARDSNEILDELRREGVLR